MSSSSSSDEEFIILAACIVSKSQKNLKVRRSLWTNDWIQRRNERSGRGELALLQNEMRVEHKTAYNNYLRIDQECFPSLLQKIQHDIKYRH